MKNHNFTDLELAVCGIDCFNCPLRIAHTDLNSAQVLVGWIRQEGW